jgi:hypothetical protein
MREPGSYRAWRSCGVPALHPLYRLPQLLASSSKPVLVTEGEKKADRAYELFPDFESTTTMGGAKQPHLTDFSALANRSVVIRPDHDDVGRKYALNTAALALAAGPLKSLLFGFPMASRKNGILPTNHPPALPSRTFAGC